MWYRTRSSCEHQVSREEYARVGEEGSALRFMGALADALLALLGGATFVEASAAGNFVALEEVANASIATTFFWSARVNIYTRLGDRDWEYVLQRLCPVQGQPTALGSGFLAT